MTEVKPTEVFIDPATMERINAIRKISGHPSSDETVLSLVLYGLCEIEKMHGIEIPEEEEWLDWSERV